MIAGHVTSALSNEPTNHVPTTGDIGETARTMSITDLRVGVIEDTWHAASDHDRLGYIAELGAMASTLERVIGPEAEHARWLSRRVHRVARQIAGDRMHEEVD